MSAEGGDRLASMRNPPPRSSACFRVLALFMSLVPFAFLYRWLSLNQAGGYYKTFYEQFSKLPTHLTDILDRRRPGYSINISKERQQGIFRTVNALESSIILLWFTPLCIHHEAFQWTAPALYFLVHRCIGSNCFRGKYSGLFQPEGMWQFHPCDDENIERSLSCDIGVEPLQKHPSPSY
eukprot:TRINITY_DN30635_c0_g1_i1.p1 TRINITY_DN30635_c0_g1~~TRINITY_DN30635_c0_g1_i1.p1  ORF type:complete len:180 (-),score=13.56 TRINITY_DN30635_c0_g1_i1:356-895(-)